MGRFRFRRVGGHFRNADDGGGGDGRGEVGEEGRVGALPGDRDVSAGAELFLRTAAYCACAIGAVAPIVSWRKGKINQMCNVSFGTNYSYAGFNLPYF